MTHPILSAPLIAAFAVAVAWSSSATAEVYKWVDHKGVTNYSSTPPATGKARSIDLQSASVSVYEAPPPERTARALDAAMRARMERLENELLAERRARQTHYTSAQADSDRRQLAYEQCLRDRRVDCDQVRDGLYATPSYSPHYVVATPWLAVVRPYLLPQFISVRPQPVFGAAPRFPGNSPRVAAHRGPRELSRQGR